MNISRRQYRILSDHMAVYDFMVEIFEKDWKNGVPAPFMEYALSSSWMDKSFVHRNRLWFDGDSIAAFCFYENPVSDVYFSLRPGYEFLADEMIEYAFSSMPRKPDEVHRLVLFSGQNALMNAAERAGYTKTFEYDDMIFDFEGSIDYPLPDGFRFVPAEEVSIEKCCECCWKGFDHEAEEGAWNQDAEYGYYSIETPHNTHFMDVVIADSEGEYACYSGMWWVPENKLAYMEPLCTIPKYRKMGLASAALSEHCRQMKKLGAAYMTGGGNEFYRKIGYKDRVVWTFWEKR
ncbi:MAG: GNAT family N-acetyltransferase [Clostridia bacterium]|nr:GNAT family N-acetyltransferase [Clostridia bacterium]